MFFFIREEKRQRQKRRHRLREKQPRHRKYATTCVWFLKRVGWTLFFFDNSKTTTTMMMETIHPISNNGETIVRRRRRSVKSPSNKPPRVGSVGHALLNKKTHLHFHLLELLHGRHLFGSNKFLRCCCCCVFGLRALFFCVFFLLRRNREKIGKCVEFLYLGC